MRTFLIMFIAAFLAVATTVPAIASVNDDQVTSQKIKEADGTSGQNTNSGSGVKEGHIQNGAVTTSKIAVSAVTTTHIANGAVTDAKISGQISATKISSTGLNADTVDGLHASSFATITHGHSTSQINGLDAALSSKAAFSHAHNANDITTGLISVDKLASYKNIFIVHQGSINGVNTFNSITEAINHISSLGNSCSGNPYLIIVGPGTYTEDIYLNVCVTIRGSGQEITKIVGTGQSMATVFFYDSFSALENLTVVGNYAGSPQWWSIPAAVRSIAPAGTLTIRGCTIDAGLNYSAIVDDLGASVTIDNSEVLGGWGYTIMSSNTPSNLIVYNSRIKKSPSGDYALGLPVWGSSMKIVGTMIDGNIFINPGIEVTLKITNCYDGNYSSIPNQ